MENIFKNFLQKNKEASPEKTRKQRRFRRPATTGHIELIAVAQAKQVKLVLLGATNVGKTGKKNVFRCSENNPTYLIKRFSLRF